MESRISKEIPRHFIIRHFLFIVQNSIILELRYSLKLETPSIQSYRQSNPTPDSRLKLPKFPKDRAARRR